MARAARTAGEVVNIASGMRVSVNRIIAEINGLLGCDIQPRHEPPRPGNVRHSEADITRARELLGYEPAVDLGEGLRRTIEWYKSV